MMKKLVALLNQPYMGERSVGKNLLKYTAVACFVALFLWFFQPFGIPQYQGSKPLMALAFGAVTWAICLLYYGAMGLMFGFRQDQPRWVFWKWAVAILGLVQCIALGNFLLINYLHGWSRLSWGDLLSFMAYTFSIGAFPIVLAGMASNMRYKYRHAHIAQSLNTQGLPPAPPVHATGQSITIPSDTGPALAVAAGEIYYLQAMENYVAVHHGTPKGPDKALVRNTLQKVAGLLPGEAYAQCHRSYIVNLGKVGKVTGNAQGLALWLVDLPDGPSVPVSRRYVATIRNKLVSVSNAPPANGTGPLA